VKALKRKLVFKDHDFSDEEIEEITNRFYDLLEGKNKVSHEEMIDYIEKLIEEKNSPILE